MAERALSSDEQVLAKATKSAIEAAGGLEVCSRETSLSTSQLSRCSSPNDRDSLTVRDTASVEAIAHGKSGHPHVTRALARLAGGVFVMLPEVTTDGGGLQTSVLDLAAELGDVSRAISDGLCSSSAGGAVMTPGEARNALDQLHDLDGASARLRHQLQRIVEGATAST